MRRKRSVTIKRIRKQVFNPLLAEHRGRIVKLMGDGVIVEFASVVDAVACAVAFQKAMAVRSGGSPPDRRIAFRIGINLGDVVVEGDDLFGDGVNVAARLEALAEPGGICISDVVQKQLEGKADFPFADIGEQQLKNITRPVRVWRWARNSAAGAADRAAASAGPAVNRRPPVRQSERPARRDLFQRRHHRGHHHRAGAFPLALRDRPQLLLRVPRQVDRSHRNRAKARRVLYPRRQRAAGRGSACASRRS